MLLFVFLFSLTPPAHAAPNPQCSTTSFLNRLINSTYTERSNLRYLAKLRGLNEEVYNTLFEMADKEAGNILAESDKKAIRTIFEDSSLSPHEQSAQSFEVYYNARTKFLNESERKQLDEILANKSMSQGNTQGVFSVNPTTHKTSIRIAAAAPYYDTLYGYTTLVHELEHAIQYVRGAGIPDNLAHLTKFEINHKWARYQFLAEYGAMKAEAEFVLTIPKVEREAVARELTKIQDPLLKRIMDLRFNHDANTIDEFIEHQWQKGRYSKQRIVFDSRSLNSVRIIFHSTPYLFKTGVAYGVWKVSSVAFHKICQEIESGKIPMLKFEHTLCPGPER